MISHVLYNSLSIGVPAKLSIEKNEMAKLSIEKNEMEWGLKYVGGRHEQWRCERSGGEKKTMGKEEWGLKHVGVDCGGCDAYGV